jgi:hypothetical protein
MPCIRATGYNEPMTGSGIHNQRLASTSGKQMLPPRESTAVLAVRHQRMVIHDDDATVGVHRRA